MSYVMSEVMADDDKPGLAGWPLDVSAGLSTCAPHLALFSRAERQPLSA